MRWKQTLQLAEVHCEGELGKVIIGGVLGIPGATMLDKMNTSTTSMTACVAW